MWVLETHNDHRGGRWRSGWTRALCSVRSRHMSLLHILSPVKLTGLNVWYSKLDFEWSLTSANNTATTWSTSWLGTQQQLTPQTCSIQCRGEAPGRAAVPQPPRLPGAGGLCLWSCSRQSEWGETYQSRAVCEHSSTSYNFTITCHNRHSLTEVVMTDGIWRLKKKIIFFL